MARKFFTMNRCFSCCMTIAIVSALSFLVPVAHAESLTPIGRYLAVSQHALPEQIHLLDQTFQVRFSREVHTVGDAMGYLLRCSGYRLIHPARLSKAAQSLLLQPLPYVHRKLGPMRLKDGLLTLAGEPFCLCIDPVHRLIGLRLKPAFQSLYGEE